MSVQHKNECRFVGTIKPNNKFKEGFELKFTAGGTAVLTINLCVTEEFKGRDGDARFKSTYIPVRAWGERAEEWAKSLSLYAVIDILTAFRTSSYTTREGEKRYEHKFDVIALKVLGQSSASEGGDEAPAPRPAASRPAPRPTPAASAPAAASRPAAAAPAPAPRPAPAAPARTAARPPATATPPTTQAGDSALPPADDDIPF